MTPTPFCCDITSGTEQEQDEFKRLYRIASHNNTWGFMSTYYGIYVKRMFDYWESQERAINSFTRIIPLSEGIQILKEMVGEETEPKEDDNLKLALKEAISLLKRTTEYEVMDSWKDDINRLESILQPKP